MKKLFEKEIRLLLPALAGALVLAILPIWLLPYDPWNPGENSTYFYLFGVMLLALSSFGREIGLKTLPFILAQPLPRARVWWVKIIVLTVFLSVVFEAWLVSRSLCALHLPALLMPPEVLMIAGFSIVVFTAGGLWMTLLLRQTVAAFWLTLLIPAATSSSLKLMGGPDWLVFSVLGLYAVAGFFLARWQFLHVQDTAWTGGVLSFDRVQASAERGNLREHKPWAALFRKELQLQQITLVGVGCLLVLHLGVMLLRKAGLHVLGKMTLTALEMFGGLWVIVPFLAGSQSVADERQLGTLDALLCLPVSRRAQFIVKLLFVLAIGGALTGTLMCLVEKIGIAIGAKADLGVMGINFNGNGVMGVWVSFLALSLAGFYGSTLTRGMVPSLATGVVMAMAFCMLLDLNAHRLLTFFGWQLWPLVTFPTLAVVMIWLAYGNFRYLFESGRRWRWNLLGLIAALFLGFGSSAAIYQRVWEFALPLEEPHGPARLPAGKPAMLSSLDNMTLTAVLSDGRLWEDRGIHQSGELGAGGNHFDAGSNWAAATARYHETIGLRSNDTFWISAQPILPWEKAGPVQSPLVQFGADTDWQSMASKTGWPSLILLKQNGTLWTLRTKISHPKSYQGLRTVAPQRLGADSDWAQILPGIISVYAWKLDGSAWALVGIRESDDLRRGEVKLNAEMIARRVPALDHARFKSLNTYLTRGPFEIGIRADGTLWYWNWLEDYPPARRPKLLRRAGSHGLVQIGQDSDWMTDVGGTHGFAALKTDGSLWLWKLGDRGRNFKPFSESPVRLGTNNDWVGLSSGEGAIVALSADGTLWSWQRSDFPPPWTDPNKWLVPSRRPVKIENIFDDRK